MATRYVLQAAHTHTLSARITKKSRALSHTPRQTLVCTRTNARRRLHLIMADKTTGNTQLDEALRAGKGAVDTLASFVPESVPRPMAKGGVAVFGTMLVFWLIQKVVSTVLTFALLGGAAWLYFKSSGSSNGNATTSGSKGADGTGTSDDDDPLSEARRIMEKYK